MWLGSQRELASDSCVVWGWLRVPEVPLRERGGKGGDPSCLRVPSVSHGVGGDPGMSPPKSEGDGSGPWGGGKEGWGCLELPLCPLCVPWGWERRGWGRGGDGGSSELPPCPLRVPWGWGRPWDVPSPIEGGESELWGGGKEEWGQFGASSVSLGAGGDPGMSPPLSEGGGLGLWDWGEQGWGELGAASMSLSCPLGRGETPGCG